ncbi:MAG TPA: serine hydrolase [Lapillicoccus sp.]|nr:serine hydrolase [Lapillicoccus sp.]
MDQARALEQRMGDLVATAPGRLGVAVRDDRGWSWSHEANRVTRSASTIKVPILLAVLRLVEAGRLDLADEVRLAPFAARVGGFGPLSLLPSVTALPLLEALRLMIALSDNDATNAVLDHAALLGSGEVARLLAEVPTRHTRLQRRMMDPVSAAAGLENETCPQDLADLLVALKGGRLLGPELSGLAIGILRDQQLVAGLPAYLSSDVTVGSKTGDLPGLRADLALMERGERWVAVAVVADGLTVEESGQTRDRGTSLLPVFAALGELAAERLSTSG